MNHHQHRKQISEGSEFRRGRIPRLPACPLARWHLRAVRTQILDHGGAGRLCQVVDVYQIQYLRR